ARSLAQGRPARAVESARASYLRPRGRADHAGTGAAATVGPAAAGGVNAVNREGDGKESEMRKIVAGLQVTLDGVIEAPERWNGPYFSRELGQIVGSLIGAGDALLLGRVTYQTFAAAFGGQSGGMADQMNNVRKVVVSTTLDRADWQNSTLIKSDVADEIAR